MASLLYWVWLSTVLMPGTDAFAKLRISFSSPEDIYHADEDALRRVLGSRYRAALHALANKSLKRAQEILDFAAMKHVGILTYDDPRYPSRLKEIPNPPVLLYYAGNLPDLESEFCVAVVGSREPNEYGARLTFELAHDLAAGGGTVVSGLAYGVDSIALAAAINGNGKVIAVLGSGIDVIYPKEHVKLARMIASHGVVMTEYPPGTKPFGPNFPVRNRIISGLSHAVLVTSASLHSGALITAHHATVQNRQLFALPGNVDDFNCEGTALLLREGAKAAVCAEDILYANEQKFPGVINLFRLLETPPGNMEKTLAAAQVASKRKKRGQGFDGTKSQNEKKQLPAGEDYLQAEWEKVASDPIPLDDGSALETLDDITRAVYEQIPASGDCFKDSLSLDGVSVSKITVAITKLEIKHLVKILPGGRIMRLEQTRTKG